MPLWGGSLPIGLRCAIRLARRTSTRKPVPPTRSPSRESMRIATARASRKNAAVGGVASDRTTLRDTAREAHVDSQARAPDPLAVARVDENSDCARVAQECRCGGGRFACAVVNAQGCDRRQLERSAKRTGLASAELEHIQPASVDRAVDELPRLVGENADAGHERRYRRRDLPSGREFELGRPAREDKAQRIGAFRNADRGILGGTDPADLHREHTVLRNERTAPARSEARMNHSPTSTACAPQVAMRAMSAALR